MPVCLMQTFEFHKTFELKQKLKQTNIYVSKQTTFLFKYPVFSSAKSLKFLFLCVLEKVSWKLLSSSLIKKILYEICLTNLEIQSSRLVTKVLAQLLFLMAAHQQRLPCAGQPLQLPKYILLNYRTIAIVNCPQCNNVTMKQRKIFNMTAHKSEQERIQTQGREKRTRRGKYIEKGRNMNR